jgi:hypothetical protein
MFQPMCASTSLGASGSSTRVERRLACQGLVGGEFDAALADAGGEYGGDGRRL